MSWCFCLSVSLLKFMLIWVDVMCVMCIGNGNVWLLCVMYIVSVLLMVSGSLGIVLSLRLLVE